MIERIRERWSPVWSMKGLLVVILLLAGMIPMLLQGKILTSSMRQTQIDNRIIEVQNQCLIISNKLTRMGYMSAETKDPLLDSEIEVTADIFNGRIVLINKDFKIIKDTFNLSVGRTNIAEEVIRCFQGENSSKYDRENHFFIQIIPVYDNSEEKKIDGVLMAIVSTENILLLEEQAEERMIFFQLVAFWMILLAVVLVVKLLMRPLNRLQLVLNKIAAGDLDADLSNETYRETANIAAAVDQTLGKLKAVDQSRQEFVSNVSHELKTPITSIRVLADSLMSMEDAPVDLYREFMNDISDEIDRESKIIDDLLTLVKMDKAATELNITQVNINALLELILKRIRPIAKKRNIELIFESIREVTAEADEVKLSLALNNLVENAVKYNIEEGWVRVTLDADHKFFYVKVMDSGIGIPEEFQEHVFERFYRVDKARSRETGGTGLGLAITRSVVLMHQGAIKLQSKEGEGTTFTVRIPLTYIS